MKSTRGTARRCVLTGQAGAGGVLKTRLEGLSKAAITLQGGYKK